MQHLLHMPLANDVVLANTYHQQYGSSAPAAFRCALDTDIPQQHIKTNKQVSAGYLPAIGWSSKEQLKAEDAGLGNYGLMLSSRPQSAWSKPYQQ